MKIICIDRRKRFRYTCGSFIIYRVIYRKTIMKFKLSLISTALLASFSASTFAETEQAANTNTEVLEQINVQDTVIKRQGHPSYQKLKCLYSIRQILSISFRLNY